MRQHAYPTEAASERRASQLHIRPHFRGPRDLRTTSSGRGADQGFAPPTAITVSSRCLLPELAMWNGSCGPAPVTISEHRSRMDSTASSDPRLT